MPCGGILSGRRSVSLPAASAVFRLAETGNATIVVPAIAIAEFYFLSAKLKQPVVAIYLVRCPGLL